MLKAAYSLKLNQVDSDEGIEEFVADYTRQKEVCHGWFLSYLPIDHHVFRHFCMIVPKGFLEIWNILSLSVSCWRQFGMDRKPNNLLCFFSWFNFCVNNSIGKIYSEVVFHISHLLLYCFVGKMFSFLPLAVFLCKGRLKFQCSLLNCGQWQQLFKTRLSIFSRPFNRVFSIFECTGVCHWVCINRDVCLSLLILSKVSYQKASATINSYSNDLEKNKFLPCYE